MLTRHFSPQSVSSPRPMLRPPTERLPASLCAVTVAKHAGAHAAVICDDVVPVEEPLEIKLAFDRDGLRVVRTIAVTMRTPGHDRELALGFLVTEGILRTRTDVADASATKE